MQGPAATELPPGYLAVVFIPSGKDGEESLITAELSRDSTEVFGDILRALKATTKHVV